MTNDDKEIIEEIEDKELTITYDKFYKKYKIVALNSTIAMGSTIKSALRNLINAPDFDYVMDCL